MTCVYCKKDCPQALCLFCDGKFIARDVFKQLTTVRNIIKGRNPDAYFNEYETQEDIKRGRMQGLDKLTQEERIEFMAGYNAECARLKA